MKTPSELTRERAEAYVRDRGWRHEPLTWEEVAALLEHVDAYGDERLHIDEVTACIAGVAMSKTARRALAEAFGVDVADLTPRSVA